MTYANSVDMYDKCINQIVDKKSQSMYEWMNNKAINETSLIHLDVKLPIIF